MAEVAADPLEVPRPLDEAARQGQARPLEAGPATGGSAKQKLRG